MRLLFVHESVRHHPLPRLLRYLGIDYEIAYFTGDLHTRQGTITWNNDTAIRNYLRQFNAVLVGIRANTLSATAAIFRSFRWLDWNDPEDPPVAYVGVDPRAGYADMGTLPSDFPIIRPDSSNPSGTLFAFTTAAYANTAGLRVQLHRENTHVYTNCVIAQATTHFALNDGYLYRLNLAAHNALGANGEILATPVSEDLTFPNDVVCAYRYRKRFLLPLALFSNEQYAFTPIQGMFWVLYALKLLGIQPRHSIPFHLAMDSALMLFYPPSGNPAGLPTQAQFARIGYETYRYLAETFYPRTGCAMVCGLATGGRYRTGYGPHWNLVMNQTWESQSISSETHGFIMQWHELLKRHHYGAFPCTIQDHTVELRANRTFSNFIRHSDSGYPHAAPNDVPITRGTALIRADGYASPPPGARERWVAGERYFEWGMSTSGTGTTIPSITPNNPYAARLILESAVAEMRTYGFPDTHGGEEYRIMLSPNNFVGDVPTWRAIREIGYQALRANLPRTIHSPADTNPTPPARIFEGLHFLNTRANITPASVFEITMGLFYPGYETRTATGRWSLDLSSDISSIWNTDRPTAARRAYRRALGAATESWLQCAWGDTEIVAHPNGTIGWADPTDPIRPFDPNDPMVRINFLLEVAWNMERIVRVLSPFLKFGTVKELVAMRERVLNPI